MAYESTTIANVINKLNTDYFLPSLQREYVWDEKQIIKLFDSLMQGYPISSFLFWRINPSTVDNLDVYRFIRHYEKNHVENELHFQNNAEMVLVLDGQQRLTSFAIGLCGSFIKKANQPLYLYLNLLKDHSVDLELNQEKTFDFGFYRDRVGEKKGDLPSTGNSFLPFRVSDILNYRNEEQFVAFRDKFIDSLNYNSSFNSSITRKFDLIRSNLNKLFYSIAVTENISYFTETGTSQERILDIFVRANSAGKVLGKSDLMLSTIVTSWGRQGVRSEIKDLKTLLNNTLRSLNDAPRSQKLSVDWIMKSCLVAVELDCAYKVSNFNRANMNVIKDSWEIIKETLIETIKIVKSFGLDSKKLSSTNALMPIVYFIHSSRIKNKVFLKHNSVDNEAKQNLCLMKLWLTKALIARTFGGSSDNTIAKSIVLVKSAVEITGIFPENELVQELRGESTFDLTNTQGIEDLLTTSYSSEQCFHLLSLLYGDVPWEFDSYHMDHIFPQTYFTKTKYKENNISSSFHKEYTNNKNCLANLCLLTGRENQAKGALDIRAWVKEQHEDYPKYHCIPEDRNLLSFSQFLNFIEKRKQLIQSRLSELLLT